MMLLSELYLKNNFEKRCLQLVLSAYHVALKEKIIKLNWIENDISTELHRLMEINEIRKNMGIIASTESHIPNNLPKVKGYSNKYKRIDLILQTIQSNYEFKYYFEAKNLKETDTKLKRRYINEGIHSFISLKYPKGSMLGYLIEGDLKNTIVGINKLIKKDKKESEILNYLPDYLHPTIYISNHDGFGTLKHIILDFTILA